MRLQIDRAGGQKLAHTADSAVKDKFGNFKLKVFKCWKKSMFDIINSQQAYSWELAGVCVSTFQYKVAFQNAMLRQVSQL